MVQHNVVLAITKVIKTRLYKNLGTESLSFCWWFRRRCTFYEIKAQGAPKYLYKLIPLKNNTRDIRSTHSVSTYYCTIHVFKYSFFHYTIWEWNKLDFQPRNAESFKKFRNTLLKLGWPTPDVICEVLHPLYLKLLTRSSLGLSHHNKHRFKHNFENCINPLCTCSLEVESAKQFFLRCHHYSAFLSCMI